MNKYLIVNGVYPFPETFGGNIRTMNFARYFMKKGVVDIAYLSLLPEAKPDGQIFNKEIFIDNPQYPQNMISRLKYFVKGVPYPAIYYTNSNRNKLLDLIRREEYECIFVRYIKNAQFCFSLPKIFRERVIVDFDDIISDSSLYETFFNAAKNNIRRILRKINRYFLNKYEYKCLQLGAATICSEMDKGKFKKEVQNEIFVVPNIYHNESFEKYDFGNGFVNKKVLLFIGSLNYTPNIQGLKWFLETIYPDFKKAHRDSRILVVGRMPSEEVKTFTQSNPDISVYANVADVKEYYSKCGVVVVPLLTGGGTRIKILEAGLANRPVLTTPKGVEGLDLRDGKDVLIFCDSAEFNQKYLRLSDEKYYKYIIYSAKEEIKKKYSQKQFESSMDVVLDYIEHKSK